MWLNKGTLPKTLFWLEVISIVVVEEVTMCVTQIIWYAAIWYAARSTTKQLTQILKKDKR
jgi:hypothetical protein